MTDLTEHANDLSKSHLIMSDHTYALVKHMVQVVLPALGALYFGLAQIWGLPSAENVVGTLAIVTTFLGVALGISTNYYNNSDAPYDGRLFVIEQPEPGGKKTMSLELDGDPEEIVSRKDSIRFKVMGPVTVPQDDI